MYRGMEKLYVVKWDGTRGKGIALVSATNPKEASGYIVERHGTPLPVNAVLIPEALQGVKVESPIALLLATGK